ncbi:MAG: hypothetical protein FWD33_01830 [Alphaproteobacteria bacterium]|nr:hypothetical protein [Alphaproteobacteria bacterium]
MFVHDGTLTVTNIDLDRHYLTSTTRINGNLVIDAPLQMIPGLFKNLGAIEGDIVAPKVRFVPMAFPKLAYCRKIHCDIAESNAFPEMVKCGEINNEGFIFRGAFPKLALGSLGADARADRIEIGSFSKDIVTPRTDDWEHEAFKLMLTRGYVLADGIVTKLVNKKKSANGMLYKTKKIGASNDDVWVVEGQGQFAHGRTPKEAQESLDNKLGGMGPDLSKVPKGLTLDSVISVEEAKGVFQITRACLWGIEDYIEEKELTGTMTVRNLIEMTKGYYKRWDWLAEHFGYRERTAC